MFASVDFHRFRTFQIGDMLGHMAVSELSTALRNRYDVIAETDGLIALIPFGEIKGESRKSPLSTYRVLELASKKALEVFHYNVFGHEMNPVIRLTATTSAAKKVREFFLKNPIIKAFLKGFDRKDEKVLMGAIKTSELDPADRLVRKGTSDRSIIMVVAGQFIGFGDAGQPNLVYKEGAVLGVEEFLKGHAWPRDLICSQAGVVCKFTHEGLLDMIHHSPVSAIKMVRRIVRHQCYEYIY